MTRASPLCRAQTERHCLPQHQYQSDRGGVLKETMPRLARFVIAAMLLGASFGVQAATCTSKASGNWNAAGTWTCTAGTFPAAADTVIIVSPHTVTLNNNYPATNLTVNVGATLRDNGNRLTLSGSAVIDGTFGRAGDGGKLIMTGAGQTLSGSGTFIDVGRIQIDANITIPAGSNLKLTLGSEIRVGSGGAATLTIDGAIDGTGQSAGNRILRVDNGSTVTINGSINAPNSRLQVRDNATVTNNGSAVLQSVEGRDTTSVWTNAANSTLDVNQTLFGAGNGTLNASAAGNTVNYSGAAQTVMLPSGAPATYYNLTLTGSGTKDLPTAAMTIAGNLTVSGTATANTRAALTIGGNLDIAAAGATFDANTYTHNVAGNFINNGSFIYTAGSASTINMNGTAAQTISGTATTTFQHLTISNAAAGVTASSSFNLNGNFTNNGVFDAGTSTVTFNGTAAQSLSGNATTFYNLTMNNTSTGLTINNNDVTVGNLLTFTAGNIDVATGGFTLITTTTDCTAPSVSRPGTGHVIGNLRKRIPTGSPSCTFEVGDSAFYTPVDLAFTAVIQAGNMTVSTTSTDHPQIATSRIDANASVNRYWTLTNADTKFGSYTATFTYIDPDDQDDPANAPDYIIQRYAGGTWFSTTLNGTPTATQASASGITDVGDFAIGAPTIRNFSREKEFIYQRELYY